MVQHCVWKAGRQLGLSGVEFAECRKVRKGVSEIFSPIGVCYLRETHIRRRHSRMHPKFVRFQTSTALLLQSVSNASVHLPLFIARNG